LDAGFGQMMGNGWARVPACASSTLGSIFSTGMRPLLVVVFGAMTTVKSRVSLPPASSGLVAKVILRLMPRSS